MKSRLWMHRRSVIVGGLLVGAGVGRLIDGTVLEVMTDWYRTFSPRVFPDTLAPWRMHVYYSVIWGVFSIGLVVLWRVGRGVAFPRMGRAFMGSLLMGWGAFNFMEGILYRQLYGMSSFVAYLGHITFWDLLLMVKGCALLTVGWVLTRQSRQRHDDLQST